VFNNASILDDEQYIIHEDDFVEEFHKIIFGSMYRIHENNSKVNLDAIIDYLANRPKYNAVFQAQKGIDYLIEAAKIAKPDTFNYYYHRLKKFTLLRTYNNYGIDVRNLYDPDLLMDLKAKQKQEDWLDSVSLTDIADIIDKKVAEIRATCVEDDLGTGYQAGEDIFDLIEQLKTTPEIGVPLYGPLINTVTKGARLRKFYLRSAATGIGKTRGMIADACNIACNEIYHEQFGWIKNGKGQPTLFIVTEQDKGEV